MNPLPPAPAPSAGPVRTKAARQAAVRRAVTGAPVRSQTQLAELLAAAGFDATQATLSRDLDELGAVKVRHDDGSLVYAVPGEGGDGRPVAAVADGTRDGRLARRCAELLLSAEPSANLVVLRTPPGAAQFLASSLDHAADARRRGVIGTLAGDDTVLVITRDLSGGASVAAWLSELAGSPARRAPQPDTPADLPEDPAGSPDRPTHHQTDNQERS